MAVVFLAPRHDDGPAGRRRRRRREQRVGHAARARADARGELPERERRARGEAGAPERKEEMAGVLPARCLVLLLEFVRAERVGCRPARRGASLLLVFVLLLDPFGRDKIVAREVRRELRKRPRGARTDQRRRGA